MARDDFDLVLHLGDYIYEQAGQDKRVRKHLGPEIMTLADYRTRHAQYRSDAALQAMHAAAPWVVTWDDHELDNNCAGAISEEKGVSAETFLKRRAASYQAYYEHMPLARTSLPSGPDMKIYRRLAFGRLAEFFALDTRQYRTDQPCDDGNKAPCATVLDPQATILGDAQEKWLHESLAASQGRWNVLAQQVPIARVDMAAGQAVAYSMDKWAGYELNRRRVLKHLDERRISNPVSLAGDMHSNWANNLIADFDDLESKVVASEFVATSISSGGNGLRNPKDRDTRLAENPFVKFYNTERGYLRCVITAEQWRTDYQVVEDVTRPGAPQVTRASFVVENQRPGIQVL
jgi:alkaline phosphatase D